MLSLALDENRLRVSFLKSRYGGAGESFDLELDRARQRVSVPSAEVPDDPLRVAMIAALAERKQSSGHWFETWTKDYTRQQVRAEWPNW
jgi:hypothetical protein